MSKKPTLAIISTDIKIKKFLVDTISRVIGHEVDIEGYALDEGVDGPKTADLVLTSGKFIVQQAKQIFPQSPIIVGKRVITGYNLEQVIMLPKGKKVLIVNHPKFAAEETIESLLNLGISHVDYIPYWKGMDINYEEIDTAVSPGMTHLIPEGIRNKIDIGERTLSVQCFLEILLKLGLSLNYIDVFEKNYTKLLMDASRKIRRALNQSERLRKNQTIILNEIDEGILSLNEQKQIVITNPAMSKLFGDSPDLLTNKSVKEIIKSLEDVGTIQDDATGTGKTTDIIYSLEDKKIICNKSTVIIGEEKHYVYTFKEASQIQHLEQKVRRKLYEKGYVAKYTFDDIWGNSRKINAIKEKAHQFAKTEETILITGESGTGKELFAQAIHQDSFRKNKPFVALNFAAIPENLVESELFGYEEGAFTGARKGGKPGIFELAHGGTLMLDEIGDAPLYIQARLLRVLEEKEIMSLGGSRVIPVDVRIIAATNKNLLDCIKSNLFRMDLFYRLNVLTLQIPPLRDYREEIPLFLKKYLLLKYKNNKDISSDVIDLLMQYNWPGNMRELRNAADYMYYSSMGKRTINIEDIPLYLKNQIEKNINATLSEELEVIKIKLENQGNLDEIYTILDIYFEGKALGRNKLIENMIDKGFPFNESKAKKYIKFLEKLELLTPGITKQGSSLTDKGIEAYKYLTKELA